MDEQKVMLEYDPKVTNSLKRVCLRREKKI